MKRFLSLVMTLCLVVTLLSVLSMTAFADGTSDVTLTVNGGGSYSQDQTMVVCQGQTITVELLHNYTGNTGRDDMPISIAYGIVGNVSSNPDTLTIDFCNYDDGTHSKNMAGTVQLTINDDAEGVIEVTFQRVDKPNWWGKLSLTVADHEYVNGNCTRCGKHIHGFMKHPHKVNWMYDEDGHWLVCSNAGCDVRNPAEFKTMEGSRFAAHTYECVEEVEATTENSGWRVFECTTCEHSYEVKLSPTPKTADPAQMTLWVTMFAAAAAVMFAVVLPNKKFN